MEKVGLIMFGLTKRLIGLIQKPQYLEFFLLFEEVEKLVRARYFMVYINSFFLEDPTTQKNL